MSLAPVPAAAVAVGVDVVVVEDVARALERHGQRYRARVFTPHEQACCEGTPEVAARRLAARFAAKEAVIKLLRPTGHQPDWRSIEVRREAGGACSVALTGEAARMAADRRLGPIALSLCHEGPVALCVAVASVADDVPTEEGRRGPEQG